MWMDNTINEMAGASTRLFYFFLGRSPSSLLFSAEHMRYYLHNILL
jgi:hypothetical protein